MNAPNVPQVVLYVVIGLLVVTLFVGLSTSGATFDVSNSEWDGASSLADKTTGMPTRLVLSSSGYRAVEESGTVAFVLAPESQYSATDADRVRRFVREGGTVVLATQSPGVGNDLLGALGSAQRIENGTLRDDRFFLQTPAMPLGYPVDNGTYTRGVDWIALNYGTAIQPAAATPLFWTSGYSYLDEDHDGTLDDNETVSRYHVVTSESLGEGRVIVVSDPSVFINAMLEQSGNDAFADRLLATHERVVFDYSHSSAVPPLQTGLIVLRRTPLLQVLLGGSVVVLIVFWETGRLDTLVERGKTILGDDDEPTVTAVTEPELAVYLREQHPDWDDERIERIVDSLEDSQRQKQ